MTVTVDSGEKVVAETQAEYDEMLARAQENPLATIVEDEPSLVFFVWRETVQLEKATGVWKRVG